MARTEKGTSKHEGSRAVITKTKLRKQRKQDRQNRKGGRK